MLSNLPALKIVSTLTMFINSLRRFMGSSKPQEHGMCWGLVLKCYELRTRQHKMLNIKALRPLKHYFPEDLMNFGRRSWMINYEGPTFVVRSKIMRNKI
jgi:hypothetical protein